MHLSYIQTNALKLHDPPSASLEDKWLGKKLILS